VSIRILLLISTANSASIHGQGIKYLHHPDLSGALKGERSMTEVKWDLSQLVKSTDPSSIMKELDDMVNEAGKKAEQYRNKIASLDGPGLKALFEEREAMMLRYEGAAMYGRMLYSADTSDLVSKQLNDAVSKAGTKVGQLLAFMEIDISHLLRSRPELVHDPALHEFQHMLERILRSAPYLLSESEEQIIMAKDQNGSHAWSGLQREWLSTRKFPLTVDGKKQSLAYGQMTGYYNHPDRRLRQNANRSVYGKLGQDVLLWSSALRAICDDHLNNCQVRKYPTPEASSLITNDIEPEAVDALMRTMQKSVGVYQRYLRLKAKMMGLERLGNWDIMAPLPDSPNMTFSWEKAHETVVSAYSGFDPQIGEYAEDVYRKKHIDADVRPGKSSGAFCADWYNGRSAYVLQSFNGRMDDVYTQAHELGHAVHAYLSSRAQRPSNVATSFCIAECGSIFGELLLTDRLLQDAKDVKEKQAVLTQVMDGFGMAAFQVSARFFFERSLYQSIKDGVFLDGETIADLWVKARNDVYGDAVDFLPEMKWEWTMKMHYYIPELRFYNYPYVFAQLFVFSLYRLYQEQGKEFVPKMKQLLSAGSCRSAAQLAAELGFDINDEKCWQKGIEQAEKFIDELEHTL
jgi:oligoendopeptidase F